MKKHTRIIYLFLLIFTSISFYSCETNKKTEKKTENTKTKNVSDDPDKIVDGIHVRTGLKDGKGVLLVANTCTVCHSADIVMMNRMNEERWNTTIKWMQKTQGLWDLGDNQKIIVDYLTTNYPMPKATRRTNLKNIDWYELK